MTSTPGLDLRRESEFWHRYSRLHRVAGIRLLLEGLIDLLIWFAGGGPLFLENAVLHEDESGVRPRGGQRGRLVLRRSSPELRVRASEGLTGRWRRFLLPEPVGHVASDEHGFIFRQAHFRREATSGEIGIEWAKIDHLVLVPVGRQHLGITCAARDLGVVCLWLAKGRPTFFRAAAAHVDAKRLQSAA